MTIIAGCPPHHWMIETAHDKVKSKGECIKCGETKLFSNSIGIASLDWHNFQAAEALSLQTKRYAKEYRDSLEG